MANSKSEVENLEETPTEKMVTVFIPGKDEEDEGEMVITINFVEYRIPKNREYKVPEHVASFIKNQKLDAASSKAYDQKNQIKG